MRNYDFIRETATAAANRWPMVLSQLGIDVPRSPASTLHARVAVKIASVSMTKGAVVFLQPVRRG